MHMKEPQRTTQDILEIMLSKDNFSRWLGLEVDACRDGYCRLHYRIRDDMLNGFGIVHGGILFSAADSAFAFACNAQGHITVALDVSISFALPAASGDELWVEAQQIHAGNKISLYDIRTTNAGGQLMCVFKGTAYRTSRLIQ